MLRPFLIVIAAHHIHRCYLFKTVKNILPVDISSVKDGVAPVQDIQYFFPKQAVSIRQNPDCRRLGERSA